MDVGRGADYGPEYFAVRHSPSTARGIPSQVLELLASPDLDAVMEAVDLDTYKSAALTPSHAHAHAHVHARVQAYTFTDSLAADTVLSKSG